MVKNYKCFIIGLLVSLIGWRTYQTELAAGVGLMIQIVGMIVFMVLLNQFDQKKNPP